MSAQAPHPISVAALYQFAAFDDPAALSGPLAAACEAAGAKGTLILADEGINGTIAGSREGLELVLTHIRALPGCAQLDVKWSQADQMPFHRMKVRLKREIVTLGVPGVDAARNAGTYVAPEDWNALISDPGTIVIDTRNDYEVAIGTFANAANPATASFRDFPAWFRKFRTSLPDADAAPKIAMFCTGGIRCEKATAFLKAEGHENVFHLKGGILKYLETVPAEESLWQGECFVFDQRVAVGQGLAQGSHHLCHGCRMPLNADDLLSEYYQPGVSCHHCHSRRDEAQRARYAERQRQSQIAADKGIAHIGARPKQNG